MNGLTTQFLTWTYQQPYQPVKLKRIAKKDKAVLNDSADAYNDFILALAQKFTSTPEEAKAAVQEMLTDIQRCEENGELISTNEDRLIATDRMAAIGKIPAVSNKRSRPKA